MMEENLPNFDTDTKRDQYISSFIDAAAKGLFSYNINFNDGSYFLIVKPVTPLLLSELPENIRSNLSDLPKDIQSGEEHIIKIE